MAKGEAVIRQGEMCSDLVITRTGLFRVAHQSEAGEDTLMFGGAGDVITSMHSYFAGEAAVWSLLAVEDSEVWLLGYKDMERLLDTYPEFMRWFNMLLVEQLFSFEKRYLFFSNLSAERRLLNFLNMHDASLKRTSPKYISQIVPLKYIAQYLKITQPTLSRIRRRIVSSKGKGE